MSVISSENVYNLQFINQEARDLFTDRLFLFILYFLVNKTTPGALLEEGDGDIGNGDNGNESVDETGVAVDVI